MKESLYIVIADNGMGLSRTRWGAAMFCSAVAGVFSDRRIVVQTFSHPDPAATMNLASHDFMEQKLDRMLIIDTDVVFDVEQMRMLLSHDLPFVAGLYPKKVPGLVFPVMPLNGEEPKSLFDKQAECPAEVQCVARGFVSIHRSVFETLRPHVEAHKVDEFPEPISIYWKAIPGVKSEDYAFCDLYREHGGKVYVDHRITARHEGSAIYPIPGTF